MIRAVIFDCFGVLYLSEWAVDAYRSLLGSDSRELQDLLREGEYGLIGIETLHEGIARLTGQPSEEIRRRLSGHFRNQELLDYAESLRPRYRVGMLSNLGPDTMEQFFTTKERAKFFDVSTVSSEVGMVKPHPEVFAYVCQKLRVDTSEAVMVDDVEENCAGAREAGLQAIRFESNTQVMQDLKRLLESHA